LLQVPDFPDAIPCVCNNTPLQPPTQEDNTAPAAVYSHMLNCIRQQAYTTRHNQLVNLCAEAAFSVGLSPELENQVSKAPVTTGNVNQIQERKRFDVTVGGIQGHKIYQIDVSVASSYRKESQFKEGCANYVLYAADSKVTEKKNKYRHDIFDDTECVFPLVCETSGAIHKHWRQYFAILATRVGDKPPPDATWSNPTFTAYWMSRTSCTLRRENAQALQRIARAALGLAGRDAEATQAVLEHGRFD